MSFSLKYPAILDKRSLLKNNSSSSKASLLNSGREGNFHGFSKVKWKKKNQAKIEAETWTSSEGWEASCRSKQGQPHRCPRCSLPPCSSGCPWGGEGVVEGTWRVLGCLGRGCSCSSGAASSCCETGWEFRWGAAVASWLHLSAKCALKEKRKKVKTKTNNCMWGQNGCHLPFKMFLLRGEGEAARAFV